MYMHTPYLMLCDVLYVLGFTQQEGHCQPRALEIQDWGVSKPGWAGD